MRRDVSEQYHLIQAHCFNSGVRKTGLSAHDSTPDPTPGGEQSYYKALLMRGENFAMD